MLNLSTVAEYLACNSGFPYDESYQCGQGSGFFAALEFRLQVGDQRLSRQTIN